MANKTLYALLVAINNYPIQRHCLRGCVADRDEFKNYLKRNFENSDVQLKIKTLTDSEATKANIIKHFQDFKKAKSDDICLFYFSGHGSQAPAPKEFWHMEPDRMSESVVCYDSRLAKGKDLMDKEQAYLIHEVTKANNPHFIAIFDCCHSGSNTRGVGDMYTARMAEPAHTPTKIDDYYGYQYYKKVQRDGYVDLSPPKGTHIQFAAAKSNETAKELKINGKVRGIFTYYLIESLEKSGSHLTSA